MAQRYAVRIGGRGRLAPGVEANGNVEGVDRVLPAQPDAPHEELISLVFLFELDHALVTPLAPPPGRQAARGG